MLPRTNLWGERKHDRSTMKDVNMEEEDALLEDIICILIFLFERSIITK